MMRPFSYARPASVDQAVRLLDGDWRTARSRALAGGTDLLTVMKAGVLSPERLVDIKGLPGLDAITVDDDGLQIGALATLDAVAAHPVIRERYTALAEAAESAASPQLRAAGTVGGNLCQESRCWYYRGEFPCIRKGGEICFAERGQNREHAILGAGPCYDVLPSDLAPPLAALEGAAEIAGPSGTRVLPIEHGFYMPHWKDPRRRTWLEQGEIVTRVGVPAPPPGARSTFVKAMDRAAWTFALASVAVALGTTDGAVSHVRIVLGGVAALPWRCLHAEESLIGRPLTEETIREAARLALEGALPLEHNQYKVPLGQGLVRRALRTLGTRDSGPGTREGSRHS